MAVKFNVLQQKNQPLKSPQTLPKSALKKENKCANFEQNPMVDKRFIQVSKAVVNTCLQQIISALWL
jgi:hypothetical protein